MDEVVAIARKLGLHYRSDHKNGSPIVRRLVISESPLTWERANALTTFALMRNRADWAGTVAVMQDRDGIRLVPDERVHVWGEFLVCGDPALIERLRAADGQPGY
jgi:hypothetical protein